MRKTLVGAVIGALVAGAMVGGATIALAQADVIKERQENRKQTAATMRAIKGIIDAKGPTAGAVEQAAKLKTLEAAFDKLSVAAGSGDMAALTAAFTDAGKACGACHDKFRAKAN